MFSPYQEIFVNRINSNTLISLLCRQLPLAPKGVSLRSRGSLKTLVLCGFSMKNSINEEKEAFP